MSHHKTTLAIDFGQKYVGLALVAHETARSNRVLYAATLVMESKPLKALVEPRSGTRRLRRTRKTHERRLRELGNALKGLPAPEQLLRFCARRGYAHDAADDDDASTFHISREQFFVALGAEIARTVPESARSQVLAICRRHLNADRSRTAEIRPARFENRGRARCQWEGCRHNVPRAGNDIAGRLQQSLFLWLRPVFDESLERVKLKKSIDHWISELAALGRAFQRSDASDEDTKVQRSLLSKRMQKVFKNLRERVHREANPDTAANFDENWTEHYRDQIAEIVRGGASGRVRFCRDHSAAFVEHVLAGKVIPVSQELDESQLPSRMQQIIFRRIGRLIHARILPLAGGRIDRVVVERVAFDVLQGTRKAREKTSESAATELYWNGPRAGFSSRSEMLQVEFAGRCAYCGQEAGSREVEHLFHQSNFPFDSYLNIVPSCRNCNAIKGGRTVGEAGLTIHDDAYNAYCEYLTRRKVVHPYHTLKKGLLNLLRRAGIRDRGEELLGMMAANLVSISETQRSPRPLAKYLATLLDRETGKRPEIAYRAGRHTAVYRAIVLPSVDKEEMKAELDLRNHAIDAVLLACDFPSASAIENQSWRLTRGQFERWAEGVRSAAPPIHEGMPAIAPVPFVPFFEVDVGGGYCQIDLSAFNWNRDRKAAHKLDPFGKTLSGVPMKRIPAADVLTALRKAGSESQNQIESIANRGLRVKLKESGDNIPERFLQWLQDSVRAGLRVAQMSSHPADIERRRLLTEFTDHPIAAFFRAEQPAVIPWVIGIRCLNRDTGAPTKVNVRRVVNGNPRAQFYQSEAVVKALYVGYRIAEGEINRGAPIIFAVSQIDEVFRRNGDRSVSVSTSPESPLNGRALGEAGIRADFERRWNESFQKLCDSEGIAKLFKITQGCVIEKIDGRQFQLRNFDKSAPWMKDRPFHDMRRVYRSPLRAMLNSKPSPANGN